MIANLQLPLPQPTWSGELEFSGESLYLSSSAPNTPPISLGDILLRSTPPASAPHPDRSEPSSFDLLPISLPLGGRQPAILEGHFDDAGYTLHLTGTAIPARLLALADAIPQLGDGLLQLLDPTPASSEAGISTLSERSESKGKDPEGTHAPTAVSLIQPSNSRDKANTSIATEPIHIDLTATRTWGSAQVWRQTTPLPPHPRHPSTTRPD